MSFYPQTGAIYRHYKGGLYMVLMVVRREGSAEQMVVYQPQDGTVPWVRPLAEFGEKFSYVSNTGWPPEGENENAIACAGRLLTDACYEASKASGWHNNLKTGEPRTAEENDDLFPTRIALCHSELSEALEGHRKNLMDDHLPHRKMAEVELADVIIRVCDLAGAMGYDLGAAISEKLEYNRQRADHRHAARAEANGKKY